MGRGRADDMRGHPFYRGVLGQVSRRSPGERIAQRLEDKGMSEQEAWWTVEQATREVARGKQKMAVLHMVLGGLLALAGIGLSLWSFVDETSRNVVVFYGIVVVGGLEAMAGFASRRYWVGVEALGGRSRQIVRRGRR
jgi:hypothetical protein